MDGLTIVTIVSACSTPILGVMMWLARSKVDGMQRSIDAQFEALDAQSNDLTNFRVKVAEEYVSRMTLNDLLRPIMDELKKIDGKLDGKADRA